MFTESFKNVSMKFEGCLKDVSSKYQWDFRKFKRSLLEVSRVFKKSFKGVSRKIEGDFERDFSGFQGYLKEV